MSNYTNTELKAAIVKVMSNGFTYGSFQTFGIAVAREFNIPYSITMEGDIVGELITMGIVKGESLAAIAERVRKAA